MITVHHLENSRSQRILWLMEELGVDYDVKRYERNKKTNLAPGALKDIHPLGKSPVIEDQGRVVAETGAMIEYVLDVYGPQELRPAPGDATYQDYRYWLHYAEGSAFPPLLLRLILSRMAAAPMPFFAKPIAKKIVQGVSDAFVDPQMALHFGFINDSLRESGWFVGGSFTAADIIMSFPLEAFASRVDLGPKRNIKKKMKRIHARPAYQRALEKGGPYTILK